MIVFINLSFFGRGAVPRRPREEVRALIDAGYQVTVITDLKYLKYYYELIDYCYSVLKSHHPSNCIFHF